MAFSLNGKPYMSAMGLQRALCKDSGATENSMVVNHQITTYSSRYVVAAVYDVAPFTHARLQLVTRNHDPRVLAAAQERADQAKQRAFERRLAITSQHA